MGKAVKITFATTGFTYDVYTGPSESGPFTSYAIGVTGSSIVVSGTTISSFTGKTIYVKVNCPHCKDEIFPVKLMQDPLRLTGYTTNVTCPDNAESSTDYENNGTLRIYTGSGLPHPTSGYTFYITGPDSYLYTTTGTSITDLSSLSGGVYTVNAFDYMSGTTGNASFTVPERSGFGDNPGVITKPTCVGGADGSITLTYSGGGGVGYTLPSPPYVFEWYNGSTLITGTTGSTLSGLSAGTYKSRVYIKNTVCYDEILYTVTDPEICNPPTINSAVLVDVAQPIPTPTPTSTPTPTITVEPSNTDLYYYYALGDCTEMGYSTTSITNTGFGIIRIDGLCSSNIGNTLADPAHTSYYTDYNDPCGFASGYTYSYYGKSLKTNAHIPEGSVFNINGKCLSVVYIADAYVPAQVSTYNLDGLTPEPGDNPCNTCQPPFTGITWNWYMFGATRCDNQSHILVYSIFPYVYDATPYGVDPIFGFPELTTLQTGLTYAMVTYNSSGQVIDDGYCATITSYYGAFTGQTVQVPIQPLTDPVLYTNLPVGVQAVNGEYLNNCTGGCPALYYGNSTEKCGGIYELSDDPIWSTTKLNAGDIIKDDNGDCRKVLYPGTFKQIKYKGYWQSEIISMVGSVYGTNNNCSSCS